MSNMALKHACICAAGALALLAGGSFWQNKPASEWDDKEIHTMLTHSPWAKEVTVTPGGSGAGQDGSESGGRRGGGGRGGQNGGLAGNGVDEASVGLGRSDTGTGAGGGGGRGGGGMGSAGMDTPRAMPSFKFTVRWMSALPM